MAVVRAPLGFAHWIVYMSGVSGVNVACGSVAGVSLVAWKRWACVAVVVEEARRTRVDVDMAKATF